MRRACLHCGGSGCRKNYIDIAGDYYWTHCTKCKGTGKEPKEKKHEGHARLTAVGDQPGPDAV
jgi:DnaJ-class molecular chaperone